MSNKEKIMNIIRKNKDKIQSIARYTKRTKNEAGFNICKNKSRVYAQKICHGNKCSVSTGDCPKKLLGGFHTHPNGFMMASDDDIANSIMDGAEFVCVVNANKQISCLYLKKGKEYNKIRKTMLENPEILYSSKDPRPVRRFLDELWQYHRKLEKIEFDDNLKVCRFIDFLS